MSAAKIVGEGFRREAQRVRNADLRVADAVVHRTATRELLKASPLAPRTRRAVAGFKFRAILRGNPVTAALLRAARTFRGGGVR